MQILRLHFRTDSQAGRDGKTAGFEKESEDEFRIIKNTISQGLCLLNDPKPAQPLHHCGRKDHKRSTTNRLGLWLLIMDNLVRSYSRHQCRILCKCVRSIAHSKKLCASLKLSVCACDDGTHSYFWHSRRRNTLKPNDSHNSLQRQQPSVG